MIKVLFICHGNICRSPMAEFIFKDMVKKAGLENDFEIRSAATSMEEYGHGLYPEAAKCLDAHAVPYTTHRVSILREADYFEYDLIIGMDYNNLRNIHRIVGNDPEEKVKSLLSFAGSTRSVADPWYTRDFETAYNDIYEGCQSLLDEIKNGLS